MAEFAEHDAGRRVELRPDGATSAAGPYELWLAADASSPSRARDFVRVQLVAHGMDRLVDDIRLVASELATNAVRHAGTDFAVVLEFGEYSVLVSVYDSSPSMPLGVADDPTSSGGRGLAIVDALSSEWGVAAENGSKTVWATFDCVERTSAAV